MVDRTERKQVERDQWSENEYELFKRTTVYRSHQNDSGICVCFNIDGSGAFFVLIYN